MPTKTPQPPCPECEKLANVSVESNILGKFIDWLRENDVLFCEFTGGKYGELAGHEFDSMNTQEMLARYFEIDMDKVEQERRALLDWIQTEQN